MNIKLINNSTPVLYKVEKYIIKLLNKKPYKCYAKISNSELDNIYNKINNKFNTKINNNIILSIRSSFVKNHMIINNNKNISNNSKRIILDYNNKINILQISTKYDISPLNILRFIFKNKYSKKLTYIIKNNNILNNYDKIQLNIAIKNDEYSLIDNSQILNDANDYELFIQNFLTKNNIKFKTQNELVKEQIKLYGTPINTPDFLILSNLYIDNFKINWIDAKNYYGSNIYFIKSKIENQIEKYIKEYGTGSIVFKLGFSDNLHFSNTILLDNNTFLI
jgi:hypothetical protein